LDVFHVAAAMGTSASTSFGVPVETLWPCVEDVMSRKMCRVVDVAELCPARDSQMQTARLAAALLLRGALSLEMAVR
ncbi:MAG: Arginase family, partial [Pseudomonadota bacterium]